MERNINNNNNQIQHSYLVLNTNNVSTWGGYSNIDVNLQGYVIHEATLQINVSAIIGGRSVVNKYCVFIIIV